MKPPMEGMHGLVAILAPDGEAEQVSKDIEDYCGLTLEELRDWGGHRAIHPEDLAHVAATFRGAIASGLPYDIEQRLRRVDGTYRLFRHTGRPARDEGGEVTAWRVLLVDIDDRRNADAPPAASERQLQLMIDSIPAMAWTARSDGTANFFNQRYLDYIGLPLEQAQDWAWRDTIHPEDQGTISEAWDAFRRAGTGGEIEARIRRHDGVYRWFSFRSNPLRGSHGEIERWYGVNVDIDDQKRAASVLQGERHLLELIASGKPLQGVLAALCTVMEEATPECLWDVRTIDPAGAWWGLSAAPSLPPEFVISFADARLEADVSPSSLAATTGTSVIVENIADEPRWNSASFAAQVLAGGLASAWATPIAAQSGGVIGALCVYSRTPGAPSPSQRDVMDRAAHIAAIAIERLRAEEELRRREYLLATAERISGTGSFHWDMDKNKNFWSTQMYRIYEVEEGLEPVYPNMLATVHPDDVQLVQQKAERAFRGESSPENEERLVMADGRIKYLYTAFRVIRHDDGRLESVGVAQDITQRRLAEDALNRLRSELAHATRVLSLGQLAASIAHEVNQPLSGIVTNASACIRMLSADPPDIEGAIRTAQRSLRDADRATEITKRLRGLFSRRDFSPAAIDLNESVREVVAICAHDLQRRRIQLSMDLDVALPSVFGDKVQLQQVVLNLILNSADAIDGAEHQPRQILIATTSEDESRARLSVSDTGCGISQEDAGRIFEAFYTTKPDGMGMGLSVSKSIIDQHEGRFWCSDNEGPGATFEFSLPCAAQEPVALKPPLQA